MSMAENEHPDQAPWYDRASDWFNAILIKEARQSFKSRQFVAVFMLLLAISWIVSVFGLLNSGAALEFGSVGRDFFFRFYVVLAFAAVVVVPFNGFRSLLSERDLNTYDLLSITSLSPRQIVWGKLFSSLVQLFIFYSAVTPFIAFSSLMQGFSTPNAAFLLIATMLLSLYLCMAALMMSTMAKNRGLQGLVTVGVMGGLASFFFQVIAGVYGFISMDIISLSDPDFWWVAAIVVVVGASYFVLFHEVAVARLTFESDNRSTRLRVIVAAQFWLMWAIFITYIIARNEPLEWRMVAVLVVLSGLHWSFHGLFQTTEENSLSRRVRREIPRNTVWRLIKTPFLPGGSRGFILVLFHLAALWLIAVGMQGAIIVQDGGDFGTFAKNLFYTQSGSWTPLVRSSTAICAYAVIYLGIANAMIRWGRGISPDIKPAHVRVLTFLVFTAGMIFPLLMRATEIVKTNQYTICDITAPHETIPMLFRQKTARQVPFDSADISGWLKKMIQTRGYADIVIVLLSVTAFSLILVNLPAMWSGVRDLKKHPPRKTSATGDEENSDSETVSEVADL
jgi:hypothetical protein